MKKYENNPVILDGFLQLADNPTSMSAGYGIEENLTCVKSNLESRYGTSENIQEMFQIIIREKDRILAEARGEIYAAEAALREAIEASPVLEEDFLKRVHALSPIEKQVLTAISQLDLDKLFTVFTSSPMTDSWGSGKTVIAYLLATGVDVRPEKIESIIVKSGFANRLMWISSGRGGNVTEPLVIPYYVKKRKKELASLSFPIETNSLSEILSNLISSDSYAELAVLDEISESGGLIQERIELQGLPSWKGLIGNYGGYLAISPLLQNRLRNELLKIRKDLSNKIQGNLDKVMQDLKKKHWPRMEFTFVHGEDFDYWRIEAGLGRPVINVVCAPWFTPNVVKLSGGPTKQTRSIFDKSNFSPCRVNGLFYATE